jgi:nucleoside-diphosphate-sugar epimerase
MRVLVTGATGFVGSHAAAVLAARGHRVRCLVRSREKLAQVLGARGVDPGEAVVGDVTDADAVARALDGCDAVLHSAAVVALEASRSGEVLGTNQRGVEHVVGGAHARGIRSIVYVSSLGALWTPGGGPIHADSPLASARSAYARSKSESERYVRELQQAGAPIRSVYPCAVLGPDDPGLSEGNHTLRVFLRDLMVITSSGFSIVDARDLAQVLAALVEPERATGRFVIGGHYLDWAAVVNAMEELTGRRVRRLRIPGPALRLLGRAGDLAKRVVPFDFPLTAEAMDFASQWPGAVTSPEVERLGVKFRPAHETYADAIRWMVGAGHLQPAHAGRLGEPATPRRG